MSESCTLIATAVPNPENAEDMKTYVEKANPLFEALGGSAANRMKVSEVINGDGMAIVLVQDFPDREKLLAMFASDEYKALIPNRDRAFKSMNIWIAGSM